LGQESQQAGGKPNGVDLAAEPQTVTRSASEEMGRFGASCLTYTLPAAAGRTPPFVLSPRHSGGKPVEVCLVYHSPLTFGGYFGGRPGIVLRLTLRTRVGWPGLEGARRGKPRGFGLRPATPAQNLELVPHPYCTLLVDIGRNLQACAHAGACQTVPVPRCAAR
jgi:hypothetical protein